MRELTQVIKHRRPYKKILRVRCEKCNRLLGTFESAKGEVKCPRCKYIQKIDLKNNDE